MAGLENIRSALYSRFASIMSNYDPTVIVSFDNQKFENPSNDVRWVFFAFIPGMKIRSGLGAAHFRQEGVFNIACMVPKNSGTKGLSEMAQAIVDGMNDKSIPAEGYAVETSRTEIRRRGVIEGWHTMNVMGEYRYDYKETS